MSQELTTRQTILVSLVAATDAIWLPSRESHRDAVNPAVTNCYELRKQFREAGVPWSSGGRTDAERKEAQRALEDLTRDGSVTVARPHGSKTLFVRLSEAAYERTRQLCYQPSFFWGYISLKMVALSSTRPPAVYQDIFIPETAFNNGNGWDGKPDGGKLYRAAQRALPALVADWLTTRCDCQRRVYYSVTAAGWKAIDDPSSASKPDVERIPPDVRFAAAYADCLAAEQKKIFTRTPNDDGELGSLPLPVGHHDTPISSRRPAQ